MFVKDLDSSAVLRSLMEIKSKVGEFLKGNRSISATLIEMHRYTWEKLTSKRRASHINQERTATHTILYQHSFGSCLCWTKIQGEKKIRIYIFLKYTIFTIKKLLNFCCNLSFLSSNLPAISQVLKLETYKCIFYILQSILSLSHFHLSTYIFLEICSIFS